MSDTPPPRRSGARTAPPPAPRQFPAVPVAIGIVVLLGVVALLATRNGSDDTEDRATEPAGVEQVRPVQVAGDALPPLEGDRDPAAGRPAPALTGAGFDGAPVSITRDGRAKVLVFLAHWCPHCQREVPVLAEWLRDNGPPDGVELYGVATGTTPDRPNYPPSAWLRREGFTVPTLADDRAGTAAEAFGLSQYPYFVAVDAAGRVVARATGELGVERFEALVDAARRGSPTG